AEVVLAGNDLEAADQGGAVDVDGLEPPVGEVPVGAQNVAVARDRDVEAVADERQPSPDVLAGRLRDHLQRPAGEYPPGAEIERVEGSGRSDDVERVPRPVDHARRGDAVCRLDAGLRFVAGRRLRAELVVPE